MEILSFGMHGQSVQVLQWKLSKLGYLTNGDWQFGQITRKNLIQFQLDNGLLPDGEYGPLTAAVMEQKLGVLTPPVPTPVSKGETPWMDWMLRNVGQHEVAGPRANPFIVDLFSYTTLHDTPYAFTDETPWCAACVCAALEKNGYKSPRSAAVSGFNNYGVIMGGPKYGAILNLGYHVTFFSGLFEDKYYKCLGGNQADSIKESVFKISDVKSIHWPVK